MTNESYLSSHSPERQLFILLQTQGRRASVTHPSGLSKPQALTQGGHKHPAARKQQAQGSNSHPSCLFRGGHNSSCILGPPIMPCPVPCSAMARLRASPKNQQINEITNFKTAQGLCRLHFFLLLQLEKPQLGTGITTANVP